MIPTIGRRVWFWPNGDETFKVIDPAQACDAGVIFVHDQATVNLLVTDHQGQTHKVLRVPLILDGYLVPERPSSFATWMPYQIGQANKERTTEPAETRTTAFGRTNFSTRDAEGPASG